MDEQHPPLLSPREETEDHEFNPTEAYPTEPTNPENGASPELLTPPPGNQAQQQPSGTVVLASNSLLPSIPDQPNKEFVSFAGPFILACLTAWIFGILFGTIALVAAMLGKKEASVGNIVSARRLYRISCGVSIAGIVIGFIIIIIVGSVGIQKACFRNFLGSDYGCDGNSYTDANGCQQCCLSSSSSPSAYYYKTHTCSYGTYTDENGCTQCCPYSPSYSSTPCSYGGYVDDLRCWHCCDYCMNGFQNVTSPNGCKLCCSSFETCSYGSYKDANGCTHCCPGTTYSDSCYNFFQNTSYIYGCKKCCDDTIYCSSTSMTRDENGCPCTTYSSG